MATEAKIKDYVEHQLRMVGDDVVLEPEDDLVELGFDSIAYVRLIAWIKTTFGVDIPPLDVTPDRFGTVGAIASYLEGLGAA